LDDPVDSDGRLRWDGDYLRVDLDFPIGSHELGLLISDVEQGWAIAIAVENEIARNLDSPSFFDRRSL